MFDALKTTTAINNSYIYMNHDALNDINHLL